MSSLLLLRLPSRLHHAGTLLRVEGRAEGRRNASVTAGTTRNARCRLHTMSLVRAAAGRQAAQGVCVSESGLPPELQSPSRAAGVAGQLAALTS